MGLGTHNCHLLLVCIFFGSYLTWITWWLRTQSFNSLIQDPCTVTANMMATCTSDNCELFVCLSFLCIGGLYRLTLFAAYTISPLHLGEAYYGPNGDNDLNSCMCTTVIYSLFSACAGCQGGNWITYIPDVVPLVNSGLIYLFH